MGILTRGRLVVFAAAAGAAMLAAPVPTFAANPGVAVVLGSGTIAPGLDATVGAAQTVTFSGTALGAGVAGGAPVVINDTCNFNGSSDIAETDAQGDGNATGSCSGTASISASVHYQRAGAVVVLQGSATVNGNGATLIGVCVFVATSVQPVKSYQLVCAVVTV